jgi:Ni/Fe-hydrogenase subunit HybB-like protein
MKEEDAKFLIDQFNKYVSWTLKSADWTLSLAAVSISTLAVVISMASIATSSMQPEDWWKYLNIAAFIIIALVLGFIVYRNGRVYDRVREMQMKNKLLFSYLLEYFLRYKSLPNSINFAYLVTVEPDGLQKLLQEEAKTSNSVRPA